MSVERTLAKAIAIKAYVFQPDPERPHSQASPLHHAMDTWGDTPIKGLFTGTARATYGSVKCALGLPATVLCLTLVPLAQGVEWAARKALGKPGQWIKTKACLKATGTFTLNGFLHLLKGLCEMLTLGCWTLLAKGYYTAKARQSSLEKLGDVEAKATYRDIARLIVAQERVRRERSIT